MSRVVVLGSINQDIVVPVHHHPVSGESIFGEGLSYFPGGKGANQAIAAAAAGAETTLIGTVGRDPFGAALLAHLQSMNVDIDPVRETSKAPTGTALIVVDASGDNTVVVVSGANAFAKDDAEVPLEKGNAIISNFETPASSVRSFFARGKEAGCITVFNPAPAAAIPPELAELIDVCVLNETELAVISETPVDSFFDDRLLVEVTTRLHEAMQSSLVVTLGSRGALAIIDHRVIRVAALPVKVVDTTGAGDCFVGYVAAQLAKGEALVAATQVANAASALSVTKPGAGSSMPSLAEAIALLK